MTSAIMVLSLLLPTQTATNVKFVDEGFIFPVVLQIDSNQYVWTGGTLPLFKDKPTAIVIQPGPHVILCRNSTFGFPQPVEFAVRAKDGTVSWESGVTVDSKQIDLTPGQTLEVRVQKPFLSYNGQKVLLPVRGVHAVLIGTRPYWFYFSNDRPAIQGQEPAYYGDFPLGYEEYPNGMFFLADEAKWGIKGVAKDLAHKIYTDVQQNKVTPDHRGNCHWSLLTTMTPDGLVPPDLKKLTEADFEKAIRQAFEGMLAHNFHRPIPAGEIKYLKSLGMLPPDFREERETLISMAEDLLLAKGPYGLKRWLPIRAKQVEAAKKAAESKAKTAAPK